MCTKLPETFASGTRGGGRPGSMPYSCPQGGLAMGGSFSATNRVLLIPGGLAMGGSFSATNYVLPIPEGGWPWGGRFQLQTMYSRFPRGGWPWGVLFQLQTMYFRFRRKKPVQRALISGASRLNGCTHFPDGGEVIRPDPGTLAQDPPARPFSGPRKARFDAPGADFSASIKKSGKESPRPVFSAPGGVGHGGCFFSYKPRTPDSRGGWPWGGRFQLRTAYSRFRRRKSLSKSNFTRGSGSEMCTDFPGLHLGGVRTPWLLSKLGMN